MRREYYLAGDVVAVDEALALVEPLTNLTKLSGKPSVKEPLPVANLMSLSLSLSSSLLLSLLFCFQKSFQVLFRT